MVALSVRQRRVWRSIRADLDLHRWRTEVGNLLNFAADRAYRTRGPDRGWDQEEDQEEEEAEEDHHGQGRYQHRHLEQREAEELGVALVHRQADQSEDRWQDTDHHHGGPQQEEVLLVTSNQSYRGPAPWQEQEEHEREPVIVIGDRAYRGAAALLPFQQREEGEPVIVIGDRPYQGAAAALPHRLPEEGEQQIPDLAYRGAPPDRQREEGERDRRLRRSQLLRQRELEGHREEEQVLQILDLAYRGEAPERQREEGERDRRKFSRYDQEEHEERPGEEEEEQILDLAYGGAPPERQREEGERDRRLRHQLLRQEEHEERREEEEQELQILDRSYRGATPERQREEHQEHQEEHELEVIRIQACLGPAPAPPRLDIGPSRAILDWSGRYSPVLDTIQEEYGSGGFQEEEEDFQQTSL